MSDLQAQPVAIVIDDNQPGRTATIEITAEPPTLGVGTELYAEPRAVSREARSGLIDRLEGFARFLDADRKPNGAAICREAVYALKPALPAQSDDTLTMRLRQYEGQQFETTACYNGLRDEAADRLETLERQIAELRAERDHLLEVVTRKVNEKVAAEAENARLRALPLKDEVERVLDALITDILSYEKINALAPNPGKRYCWQSVENAVALLPRLRTGEQEGWRLPEGTLAVHGKDVVIAYDDFRDARRAFSILENVIGAAPSEQGGDRG